MPEPRATRTLVKSPPEIWAEISDAGSLARHLGEFGEIRITDLKAETTVVWEGDTARGTVNLEPSGWGTRVTITAEPLPTSDTATPTDEAAEAEAAEEAEPDTLAEAEVVEEPEAEPIAEAEAVEEAEPEPIAEAEAVADAEPVEEPPTAAATPEPPAPAPRKRGFFARLFGRKAAPEPTTEPTASVAPPTSVAPPASVPPPAPKAATVEEPSAVEPKPVVAEPQPVVAEAEPEPEPVLAEPQAETEPEPVVAEPQAETEPQPVVAEGEVEPVAVEEAVEVEPVVEPSLEGEIVATAAFDPERIEAVLVGVLDDLGSAHHRPFSRG